MSSRTLNYIMNDLHNAQHTHTFMQIGKKNNELRFNYQLVLKDIKIKIF